MGAGEQLHTMEAESTSQQRCPVRTGGEQGTHLKAETPTAVSSLVLLREANAPSYASNHILKTKYFALNTNVIFLQNFQ